MAGDFVMRTTFDIPQVARDGCVCYFTGGSRLHGIKVEDQDDTDEYGVYIEPLDWLLSTRMLDSVMRSTGGQRPNTPQDVDLSLYSLRHLTRLLVKGNPTIFQFLWAPMEWHHPAWAMFRDLALPYAIHHGLLYAYIGYARAQYERLQGARGQMRTHRPELISAHGYDTKYAAHVIRLVHEGLEVITHRRLVLPLPEPALSECLAVRRGILAKGDMESLLVKRLADLEARVTTQPRVKQQEALAMVGLNSACAQATKLFHGVQ